METEQYNGFSNRETWAVKLHWDNNEADYNFFTRKAKEFVKKNKQVSEFADFLKERADDIFYNFFEFGGSEAQKLFVQDVGSLWRVDWIEIAEAYYNEVKENEL